MFVSIPTFAFLSPGWLLLAYLLYLLTYPYLHPVVSHLTGETERYIYIHTHAHTLTHSHTHIYIYIYSHAQPGPYYFLSLPLCGLKPIPGCCCSLVIDPDEAGAHIIGALERSWRPCICAILVPHFGRPSVSATCWSELAGR